MIMIITATTDRQYLGLRFDSNDNPIALAPDIKIYIERTLPLPDGLRFISSNYIIDTRKV